MSIGMEKRLIDGFGDFDFNAGNAFIDHVELFGRAEGEVEDASFDKRPAVVHWNNNGFAIFQVRDANHCAEGQFAVCSGQAVHVKNFTAGCWPSVKFVRVVGCVANLVEYEWGSGVVARVRCTSRDAEEEEKREKIGNFNAPQVVACCRQGRRCGQFRVFCSSRQCHRVSPGLQGDEQRSWFRLEWRTRQR